MMFQSIRWLFDDPISDPLLAGTFILVALQFRQLRLMQRRTDALAFEVYELKALVRTMSHVSDAPRMDRADTEPALQR